MVRIFANSQYDFIGFRNKAIRATIALLVVGVVALAVRGVNYSVEFTGGTLMRMKANEAVHIDALRAGLEAVKIHEPEITPSGPGEYIIRGTVTGSDPDNT